MKYRKKPVVIEAIQCKEPNNFCDILTFCPTAIRSNGGVSGLVWAEIPTLEGLMQAFYGDYVIKGIEGEFYLCKPDIFKASYEQVDEQKAGVV